MIDPKNLNAVLAKIRRVQELSKSLVVSPQVDAERISLDGEVQQWFMQHRADLLRAAQTEARLVAVLGPIVADAMNIIAAQAPPGFFQQGGAAEDPPNIKPAVRKGASLAGEISKAEEVLAVRAAAAAAKGDTEREAKVEKMRIASDRASAQSDKLCNLGCMPVVRKGDLKDTIAGEPDSKVTL